jgi:hypothetical protein
MCDRILMERAGDCFVDVYVFDDHCQAANAVKVSQLFDSLRFTCSNDIVYRVKSHHCCLLNCSRVLAFDRSFIYRCVILAGRLCQVC